MILAGLDSDAVGLQNESGHEGQGEGQMHRMHALYAVARSGVLGIPTERLRDGDLLHAHVEVAIRSDPDGPPTLDVPHHQGHNPTEGQWLFLQDKLDGDSAADGTWVLQSRPDEGGGA